MHISPVFSR